MRILFFGDIVGQAGCDTLRRKLPALKQQYGVDLCVANGENSAEGNGITPHSAQHLLDSGVEVITTGNHVLKRREIYELLEQREELLRPLNLHPNVPGRGMTVVDKLRYQVCVVNLLGQVYMEPSANPFEAMDRLLGQISAKIILVDFHAEATAEKVAMGHYLDGRVSAVLGTHTHVQTADERILPGGTAYLTDVGMCGGRNSVLGVKRELAIRRFIDHMPVRFSNDPEEIVLNGVVLDIDQNTGKADKIQRIIV